MKTITRQDLINMIESEKGAEMVAVELCTDPRMRKTGNPFVGAVKFQSLSGVIGYDYENSVNNQLVREGKEADFVAEPRAWGTRISPKWVLHKEQRYLTLKVQAAGEPMFVFNGEELPLELVQPYLPEKKSPSTQDELEKKIRHTDIKIDNIVSINMKGDKFIIKD